MCAMERGTNVKGYLNNSVEIIQFFVGTIEIKSFQKDLIPS